MIDVLIIGGGVIGCSIARELSRYDLDIVVVEKANDICCGTSKANSGIVHSGVDAHYGSLKAILNLEGNKMMEELSKELEFNYVKNGALILCFHDNDKSKLEDILSNGVKNGVEGLVILSGEEVQKMEPNVSTDVVAALYAPTSGIVCPFGLTIALAENAAMNGVEFRLNTTVVDIKKEKGSYQVHTNVGVLTTKYVINAAGVHADTIHNMISSNKATIIPRKGEYQLYDKSTGSLVTRTIFQLPSRLGKGVLVTPTTHGNLMIGPNAVDVLDKEGVFTTKEGLEEIREKASLSVKSIPDRKVITSFSGLRAHHTSNDFVIEEVSEAPGFFDVMGIESPGLTASPAIGKMVANMVVTSANAKPKVNFVAKRNAILNPSKLPLDERNALIKERPAYGNIICRCEMISEGEIMEAIKRPVGATTIDGIKRRCRAGMGRCQGGFCLPKVVEILAKELNVDPSSIQKEGKNSKLLVGRTKMQSVD